MISSALKAKTLVFAVFFVGVVTGAVLDHAYETRWKTETASDDRSRREINQMYDLLDLSAEQRQQWESIMRAAQPEYSRLFEENRRLLEPNQRRFEELREETRSKIGAILTDEQREKYNAINESRRQRRQDRSRPD
jgi:Spy/CpxP family protein refolding chaperone